MSEAKADFGDRSASGIVEIRNSLEGIESGGFWVVVITFEGKVTAVRMQRVQHLVCAPEDPSGLVPCPNTDEFAGWSSSLGREAYQAGVREVRRRIAAGEVYQVNVCRVLSHALPEEANLDELSRVLRRGNPAPYAARIDVPQAGLDIVCASPELFLERSGDRLVSAPIKGTAATAEELLAKDYTENVMITDLVRNDLSRVCRPGTVDVAHLCAVEPHPGFVHLVSTVAGQRRPQVAWSEIIDALCEPGSVSGAPKSTALQAIREIEVVHRGPYCGAIGWIDSDAGEARLAVGIRTFWADRDTAGVRHLHFGTGAGITWGSDPAGEWWETVLKARRLISLASVVLNSRAQG